MDSRFSFLVGALWGGLVVREEGREDFIGRSLEGGRGACDISPETVRIVEDAYHFER